MLVSFNVTYLCVVGCLYTSLYAQHFSNGVFITMFDLKVFPSIPKVGSSLREVGIMRMSLLHFSSRKITIELKLRPLALISLLHTPSSETPVGR